MQVALQSVEVSLALSAEVVHASGSGIIYLLTLWLLAVKEAERISVYPDFAVPAQLLDVVSVVVFEDTEIDGAAFLTADAVKL